jgi:hypothetical protein
MLTVFTFFLLPYDTRTAPNLQLSKHAPHLMHFDWSISWGCLRSPAMQFTGHFRAHTVQPMHFSAVMV